MQVDDRFHTVDNEDGTFSILDRAHTPPRVIRTYDDWDEAVFDAELLAVVPDAWIAETDFFGELARRFAKDWKYPYSVVIKRMEEVGADGMWLLVNDWEDQLGAALGLEPED